MDRSFWNNVVLTVMDCVVLALCIDCGFNSIAIIGACYVALRLFNRDSTAVVDGLPGLLNAVSNWLDATIKKLKSKKEDKISPEDEVI